MSMRSLTLRRLLVVRLGQRRDLSEWFFPLFEERRHVAKCGARVASALQVCASQDTSMSCAARAGVARAGRCGATTQHTHAARRSLASHEMDLLEMDVLDDLPTLGTSFDSVLGFALLYDSNGQPRSFGAGQSSVSASLDTHNTASSADDDSHSTHTSSDHIVVTPSPSAPPQQPTANARVQRAGNSSSSSGNKKARSKQAAKRRGSSDEEDQDDDAEFRVDEDGSPDVVDARSRKKGRASVTAAPGTSVTLSRERLLVITSAEYEALLASLERPLTTDEVAEVRRQRRLIKNRERYRLCACVWVTVRWCRD